MVIIVCFAHHLYHQVLQHMEDVKVREMQIFDYKKKIAEAETKLKQQQNLYEAVRSDRNLYSKNLIESQDEITEMKRKLKITTLWAVPIWAVLAAIILSGVVTIDGMDFMSDSRDSFTNLPATDDTGE